MNALGESSKKAFVAYIVSGDPRPSVTLKTMYELVERGVDIIELGVPFSDPMAEGPVIQLGHERALEHHVSLTDTLATVEAFRKTNQETPVVLMGYANPIERMGYETFVDRAASSGVDGVLTVDLPPEEATNINEYLNDKGLQNIFLLAPTTAPGRIHDIVSMASGFVYYVSLKGVTGAGHLDLDSVKTKLNEIRKMTDLPLCVGFGIKDGASAKAVAEHGEGAVVGSIFVDKMGSLVDASDEDIVSAVGELAANIRQGLDS
jgi:tryptophan synthase alpha chain